MRSYLLALSPNTLDEKLAVSRCVLFNRDRYLAIRGKRDKSFRLSSPYVKDRQVWTALLYLLRTTIIPITSSISMLTAQWHGNAEAMRTE